MIVAFIFPKSVRKIFEYNQRVEFIGNKYTQVKTYYPKMFTFQNKIVKNDIRNFT